MTHDGETPADFWHALLVALACGAVIWGLTVLVGYVVLF